MAEKRRVRAKRHERMADVDEAAIRLHVEPLSEGGYVATSPDVPGLVAEGRSITEAIEIAQGLTRKIVESCTEHGDPLPLALNNSRKAVLDLLIPVGVRKWAALQASSIAKWPANYALSDSLLIGPGRAATKSGGTWRQSRKVTLPHHRRDVAEGTLRAFLHEAGINLDDFLAA
jgi:predicted RNase H-like HicB family nuclease